MGSSVGYTKKEIIKIMFFFLFLQVFTVQNDVLAEFDRRLFSHSSAENRKSLCSFNIRF